MRTVELNRNLKKEVIAAMFKLWGFTPIQKDVIIISSSAEHVVVAVKHVVYHYFRRDKKFKMYEIVPYFKAIYEPELTELDIELPQIKTWNEGLMILWEARTKSKSQNSETQVSTLQ